MRPSCLKVRWEEAFTSNMNNVHSTCITVTYRGCVVSNLFSGFPYEKVVQRTLYLQVLDYDRFSRNDPIGEVSIPLNKLDLANMQTFWKELKPCSDGSVSKMGGVRGKERKREEGKIGDGTECNGWCHSWLLWCSQGRCGSMLVGEEIEGNMERLTGRWREHRQPEEETKFTVSKRRETNVKRG